MSQIWDYIEEKSHSCATEKLVGSSRTRMTALLNQNTIDSSIDLMLRVLLLWTIRQLSKFQKWLKGKNDFSIFTVK